MLFEEEKNKDEYSIYNDIMNQLCLSMNNNNAFSSYNTSNTNIDKYFLYFNLGNYYSIYCDEKTKNSQLKKINHYLHSSAI